MERNSTLMTFDVNLKSHGGNNHFMVTHMVGGANHLGVKHRGVKPTLYKDNIHPVTRSRVVTIVVPSCLMEWFRWNHVLVMRICLLMQKSKSLIPFSMHSPLP